MLPYIDSQEGDALHLGNVHKGVVLVRCGGYRQAVRGLNEPGPPRAESACRCSVELLLKGIKGAKLRIDSITEIWRRSPGALGWGHNLPEERVVPMATSVVTNRYRKSGYRCKDSVEWQAGARRVFKRLVEVVYVGLVMLCVVNHHRLRIYRGLESGRSVRKGWEGVCYW